MSGCCILPPDVLRPSDRFGTTVMVVLDIFVRQTKKKTFLLGKIRVVCAASNAHNNDRHIVVAAQLFDGSGRQLLGQLVQIGVFVLHRLLHNTGQLFDRHHVKQTVACQHQRVAALHLSLTDNTLHKH